MNARSLLGFALFSFISLRNVWALPLSFVSLDGSSTVYPISEAVVEDYEKSLVHRVKISIGVSGTGAGLDRLCRGWVNIANASRPITMSEKALCFHQGVRFVEMPIAADAIVVTLNLNNHLTSFFTFKQLQKIWSPKSEKRVQNWSDVEVSWPHRAMHFYAPAPGSGTLSSFTKSLFGRADYIRSDYIGSQDLNIVVMGVSKDPNGIGFVSYAYYLKHTDELFAVPIESPETHEVVAPTELNIASDRYPFARKLFLYVNVDQLKKNLTLQKFLNFYLMHAPAFVKEAGYVPLSPYDYFQLRKRIKSLEVSG